jgi:hypothetical protein
MDTMVHECHSSQETRDVDVEMNGPARIRPEMCYP